ncbi:MAG: MerR family transcriptional regulator [Thermoanaerobaculia bacterium]
MQALATGHRIGEVARLTGLSVDTLRVWERRYGFPSPSRAHSGVRLFGEEDVTRLMLIQRALLRGFRPGEVVSKTAEELARILEAAPESAAPAPRAVSPGVAALLDDLTHYRLGRLRERLAENAEILGPGPFVREVAGPLLEEVGEAWACGTIDVRQEHLASEELSLRLAILLAAAEPPPAEAPSVLLATLSGERHGLGIEMAAVDLASRDVVPRLLGTDIPPREIVEAALALGVDAVGISLPTGTDPRAAVPALRWISEWLPASIALWLGGKACDRVPAAASRGLIMREWAQVDSAVAELRLSVER